MTEGKAEEQAEKVEEEKQTKKPAAKKAAVTKTTKKVEEKAEESVVEEGEKSVDETTEEKKSKGPHNYRVVYDKEEKIWKLRKDGAKRVIKSFATKAEALEYAKDLSERNDMGLTVHKKDGKFQKKK